MKYGMVLSDKCLSKLNNIDIADNCVVPGNNRVSDGRRF